MSNVLVAYFSVSGVTEKVAKDIASIKKADLYEIAPAVPYTRDDLDYTDRNSRSTLEMQNPDFRPELAEAVPDLSKYDVVFVGFPIWWGKRTERCGYVPYRR